MDYTIQKMAKFTMPSGQKLKGKQGKKARKIVFDLPEGGTIKGKKASKYFKQQVKAGTPSQATPRPSKGQRRQQARQERANAARDQFHAKYGFNTGSLFDEMFGQAFGGATRAGWRPPNPGAGPRPGSAGGPRTGPFSGGYSPPKPPPFNKPSGPGWRPPAGASPDSVRRGEGVAARLKSQHQGERDAAKSWLNSHGWTQG